MVRGQQQGVSAALEQLAPAGITVVPAAQWSDAERKFLDQFTRSVLPVLTPLAVEELRPAAALPGLAVARGRGAGPRPRARHGWW